MPLFSQNTSQIDTRNLWAANRFWMENENLKSKRYGGKSHHHWYALFAMMKAFEALLKVTGTYERGRANAQELDLNFLEHRFASLPEAFDGFTILQLSDLHIDGMPGLKDSIIDCLEGHEFDLCVLTGDYRTDVHGPIAQVISPLEQITRGISSRRGFLGILGNHDTCLMVDPLEKAGVRMLINESIAIEKDGESILIVGTDDVHYYYTDQAALALEQARPADFSIALVHSPELYESAAEQGVDLYLCGHTHAGQICLPGGRPIVKHLNCGRDYVKGIWNYRGMRGVTHAGTGTSGIPVRFNTRSEILVHTLRRG